MKLVQDTGAKLEAVRRLALGEKSRASKDQEVSQV